MKEFIKTLSAFIEYVEKLKEENRELKEKLKALEKLMDSDVVKENLEMKKEFKKIRIRLEELIKEIEGVL